ncbi:hypothetical protein [Shewanella sp. KT0246]|uniref:hypothetical protein n=1 Tax=Shewanella sp. KT0246 TaxID=2815912 RepID=UPI001BC3B11F|nr:hypothetical protein [Shewanella sp. KT0246]GIU53172.1 hypothetical protein TUM4249_28130 [Shewanella sp. KT0246]
MKTSVIALSIASLFAGSAIASTTVDVYTEHADSKNHVQSLKLGHQFDFGTGLSIEAKTDKSFELGLEHQFFITDGFYVTPSAKYLYNKSDNFHAERDGTFTIDDVIPGGSGTREVTGYQTFDTMGEGSDVAMFGLEAGYSFDFGLFASARYRMEYAQENTGFKVQIVETMDGGSNVVDQFELSSQSKIARTDLTVGYNFELVSLKATAIHESEKNKDLANLYKGIGAKSSDWSSEVRATFNGLDIVKPYVQYTGKKLYSGLNDEAIRVGITATF